VETEAGAALDAAREAWQRLRADLRAAEEGRDALAKRLADAPEVAVLEEELAREGEALSRAEAAARGLPRLRQQAEAAAKASRDAQAVHEAATIAAGKASTALAAARATQLAHASKLPPGTAAPSELRRAAEAAEARAKTLAAQAREARDAEGRTAATRDAAAKQAAEASADAGAARDAAAVAEAGFAAARGRAGFADDAAFTSALLPEAEAAALEERLQKYERALHAAEKEAEVARAGAEGLAAPDLAALEEAASLAAAASREATGLAAARRQALTERDALLEKIAGAEQKLAAARAAWEVREDLARTARGDNPQRLSLQGYVLRSLLDEALASANRRLRGMLRGRYSVRRVEEPERKNAAVGLDIAVLDEWTGQVRPAATLSGGEGFCAALALALGLADTVQAHAGARRIDALFVDEGFGTLDPEALETAMAVLSDLPGADRLVGIISHVPELRGMIGARLEVSPGRRGSTAAFRLG
jgi:exonuclease SbcC